jgi:3-hydroxyisobutyrate dehydrogenase-like beta-hydroxyacid dehydrogenase
MTADAGRSTTVGVVGLGRMGAAIASHLARRGPVIGWDVRDVVPPGVRRAEDASEVFTASAVVLGCLPSPRETAEVLLDPAVSAAFDGGEAVFVDCSTSDPASLRSTVERLGSARARVLDGPILGRPDRVGAWTVPLGGPVEAAERVRAVLEELATRVEHVGELGSGHAVKLLNNLMFAAINVVTAEAIASCDRVGIDPRRFVELVAGSNAATVSPLFRDLAPRMLGDRDDVVFSTSLLHKDASLARAMCEAAGVPLRLAPVLESVARAAVDAGYGEEDSSAVVRLYARGSARP